MNFINNTSCLVLFLYIFGFSLFAIYILIKFLKKKYIFSLFNIPILLNVFTIYVISPFHYNNQAWLALGSKDATKFFGFLNKSLIINIVGTIIFTLFLGFFEFRPYHKRNKIKNLIYSLSLNLDETILKIGFFISIIIWYTLTLTLNKGLPLFNGGRTFMLNYSSLQPIYLACNSFIATMAVYWGIKFIYYKKYFVYLVISASTVLFAGSRTPFLIQVMYPLAIVFIYNNISSNKSIAKSNLNIIALCLILIILGLALGFIRNKNGNTISVENIIKDFLYGNTFSDVRDGAFILYGYNKKFEGYLWGKNYLADLISFIPSAMSDFRRQWSWGSFTASNLFNYKDHYGLRGGWFLQPYLNFSWIGVIVIAIILAYGYSTMEKIFYEQLIDKKSSNLLPYIMITINLLSIICSSLSISPGFHDFYVYIFIIHLVIFFKVCASGKFKKYSDI